METNPQTTAICIINPEKKDEYMGNGPLSIVESEPPAETTKNKTIRIVNFLIETYVLALVLTYGISISGLALYGATFPPSSGQFHYKQGINDGRNDTNSFNHVVLELDASALNKNGKCNGSVYTLKNCISYGFLFLVSCAIIKEAISRIRGVIEFFRTGSIPNSNLSSTKHFKSLRIIIAVACIFTDLVVILTIVKMERISRVSSPIRDCLCMNEYIGFFNIWIITSIFFMNDTFMGMGELRPVREMEEKNVIINA